MNTPLPTSEQAIAYAESLRTANDCYADRCSIRLLDDLTALRTRLAEVEHERDEAQLRLTALGDIAVGNWDDATVGEVDSVVKEPRRYKDALRVLFVENPKTIAQLRVRLAECEAERDQLEKDRVNYDLLDERNRLLVEVERLTKDRDDWKAKHWKAHDDFHRQFLEMENLRQQVASATVMRGMDAQANCREHAGLQLAACDCAAIMDTAETHAQNKTVTRDKPSWSPAFESVMRRTAECIQLRADNVRLRAAALSVVKKYDGNTEESVGEQLRRRRHNIDDGNIIVEWGAVERTDALFKLIDSELRSALAQTGGAS